MVALYKWITEPTLNTLWRKKMNGKQDFSALLWWAMWLRKWREPNWVRLFLLYLYTSDRCRTEYSLEVLHTLSNLVITQNRLLQLPRLMIEPLYYTYHTSRVLVVSPWWQNWNYEMTCPLVTKKVITHSPMEKCDPRLLSKDITSGSKNIHPLLPYILTLIETNKWWLTLTLWVLQSKRWMITHQLSCLQSSVILMLPKPQLQQLW